MAKPNAGNAQKSVSHAVSKSTTAETTPTTVPLGSKTLGPLEDFFLQALEENKIYCAAKKSAGAFSSPVFRLARRLKSHAELKDRTGKDAFTHLNAAIQPDWEKLFPDVSLPSLEFVTAWEQVNIPAGTSPLEIIQKNLEVPLKLLSEPICEGYHHYLGIAFHLQRLTPRRDILLPVEPLSDLLTKEMSKPVSPQSVSYYCRQAKQDGFIKLVASAHHPSGKAARYRFDLSRFSESGEELAHAESTVEFAPGPAHFNHGNQGSHGNHGIDGSDGNKNCSSSCGLTPAEPNEQSQHTNQQGEKEKRKTRTGTKTKKEQKQPQKKEEEHEPNATQNTDDNTRNAYHNGTTVAPEQSPPSMIRGKNPNAKKRQSVVTLWQSFKCSRFGWQNKLSKDEFKCLVKFGRRTDEFGPLILEETLHNWESFAQKATGRPEGYPAVPDVEFFLEYQAVAFRMWTKVELDPYERAAFIAAVENSSVRYEELHFLYAPGEDGDNNCEPYDVTTKASGHEANSHTPGDLFRTATPKKKRVKEYSIVPLWQSVMYQRFSWQEKLSDDDCLALKQFEGRTYDLAPVLLDWTLNNWDEFAQEAVGGEAEYPSMPNVSFFSTHQAVAFNLWLRTSEEACEWPEDLVGDLGIVYSLGEEALLHKVMPKLRNKGLVKKNPQGQWEVCGQVFGSMSKISDMYGSDAGFRTLLRNAAAD